MTARKLSGMALAAFCLFFVSLYVYALFHLS